MSPLTQSLRAAALLAALHALSPAHAAGDPAAGKLAYTSRCAACHSIDYNGVGPAHKNLIGRHAGSLPGFSYSKALKESGVVWDEASLSRWLTDPEKFIPGQKMFFQVPDPKERADIIAYLLQAGRPQSAPSPSTARKPGE